MSSSAASAVYPGHEREHSVTYPCPAEDHPGNDIVFIDSFPIEGGRGKFVAADIIDPDERPDDEYPVILTTGSKLELSLINICEPTRR